MVSKLLSTLWLLRHTKDIDDKIKVQAVKMFMVLKGGSDESHAVSLSKF